MTKQFTAISAFALRKGFEVAELQSAIIALLYGLWLVYPTPESAKLLAVDAYSASFLAIGSGQLIGMVQRRYSLRRVMSLLAVLIWLFTAFYSIEPAQLVFAAVAGWAFLRIGRSSELSVVTPKAGKAPVVRGQIREEYAA
jgi:predicted membrane protein